MSSTTYISIDVAVRSLAIGVYRMKSFTNMDSYRSEDLIEMNSNINDIIKPLFMKVFDINDGKKTKATTITDKAVALKTVLSEVDKIIEPILTDDNVEVLIEYQLSANHGSNAIFNMLVYHYSGTYKVIIVKPSLKNTNSFHPKLSHSAFLGGSSSNYSANKRHAKYNMLYFLELTDRMDMIGDIAKKNWDDIADTLMQAIAIHKRGSIES